MNAGWLDIASAPRDGTEIVIAASYEGKWEFIQSYWRDYMFGGSGFGAWMHHPTHWQPLPAPPDRLPTE